MTLTQNRYYSNLGQSVYLNGAISNSALSMTVSATSGIHWPTSYPFVLSIDPGLSTEELVLISNVSGTTCTISPLGRGFDGTTAVAHANNAIVVPKICQLDLAEPQQHLNLTTSTSGAHGLPASAWLGGQYGLIYSTTLSVSAASIPVSSTVFSTIPSGTHNLSVVIKAKSSNTAAAYDLVQVQYNGITTLYSDSYQLWSYNASSATVSGSLVLSQAVCGIAFSSFVGTLSTGAGQSEISFPFYNESSWVKTHNFRGVATDSDSYYYTALGGGGCDITTPITSLNFTLASGLNFLANSTLAMYAY